MKTINLSFHSISQYQQEIMILNQRIKKLGGTSKIHDLTLTEWKVRYVSELLYAKELKKLGKFN